MVVGSAHGVRAAELGDEVAELFREEAVGVPWGGQDLMAAARGDDPCVCGEGDAVTGLNLQGDAIVEAALERIESLKGVCGDVGADEARGDGIGRCRDEAWVGNGADGADFPASGGGGDCRTDCPGDIPPDCIRHQGSVHEEVHAGSFPGRRKVDPAEFCQLGEEGSCCGGWSRCSLQA
jgi:hypothetical protein